MKHLFNLFLAVLLLSGCETDKSHIGDPESATPDTIIYAKGQKVDVCHNGQIKSVSINAIPAHQGHGDGVDMDGDGFFDIANPCSETDCDDNNAAVNPAATEIVYNGIDDDCDPSTLDDDLDEDGFINADDCDDNDPTINPDAEEVCENGIDDNCNGEIDEDCIVLPDPIAFYPFNGNANDESANSNNGTVVGATLTSDRNGLANSAYSFDGINDFIQIPTATQNNFGTSDFTISLWIRSTSTDEGVIFNKRNTSSCSQASGPRIGFNQTSAGNGNSVGALFRNSSGDNQLYSQTTASDGNWHNIILVRNGIELLLYFDGQLEATDPIPSGSNFSTTLDLFIGKTIYCTGNHFTGDIDDFTIYDMGFDQAQIDVLYLQ